MLELLDESAGNVPETGPWIVTTPPEQDATIALDQRLRPGDRVRVDRRAALLALGLPRLMPERATVSR